MRGIPNILKVLYKNENNEHNQIYVDEEGKFVKNE